MIYQGLTHRLCFQVIDFFGGHADASSATRSYKQAIETIRGNIDWMRNNENTLANILSGK